jgi:FixJ family two-component response regulator
MSERRLVSIVDDSDSVRESLAALLEHVGFAVEAFASAEAFLASDVAPRSTCLILDVGLPGMSGPDLQRELLGRGSATPVIFITALADSSLGPNLMRLGAVACLYKPFSDAALLAALAKAHEGR